MCVLLKTKSIFYEIIAYSETKLGENNNEGKTTLLAPIKYQVNSILLFR